jgi:hypothetical protein
MYRYAINGLLYVQNSKIPTYIDVYLPKPTPKPSINKTDREVKRIFE